MRRRRTFVETLARSLTTSGFFYALVLAYVLPLSLAGSYQPAPLHLGPAPGALERLTSLPGWNPANARRFPGCVDMAQWSQSRAPTTVVVVRRDGDLARLHFEDAVRRATSPSAADDVWTIGACA